MGMRITSYPSDLEPRTVAARKQMLQPCSSTSSFKVPRCEGCKLALVTGVHGS